MRSCPVLYSPDLITGSWAGNPSRTQAKWLVGVWFNEGVSMKKRLKKIFSLNKRFVKKHNCEVDCIVCGLGYDIRKRKQRIRRFNEQQE